MSCITEKKNQYLSARQTILREHLRIMLMRNLVETSAKQRTQSYQREFTDNPKERQLELIEQFKSDSGEIT